VLTERVLDLPFQQIVPLTQLLFLQECGNRHRLVMQVATAAK